MITGPITLKRKPKFDESELETGSVCLGFDKITLLFYLGPGEGGGSGVLIEGDEHVTVVNSNDIAHDAPAYELIRASRPKQRRR